MQRLCVTFSRGMEVQYLAHLDLLRLWHRALRRAGLPLVYSQGFSPHPHLSLACPLPVGVTSQGELLELHLCQRLPLKEVWQAVEPCLPVGLAILQVEELPPHLATLPSPVRWTDYRVEVPADRSRREVDQAIERLLAAHTLPWQHQRDTGPRHYDLRPLVLELETVPQGGTSQVHLLRMRLRWDNRGAGRPEQVAAALGLPQPRSLHRLQVGLRLRSAEGSWPRYGANGESGGPHSGHSGQVGPEYRGGCR